MRKFGKKVTMSGRFCWWLSIIASFCGMTTFLLYFAFISTTEVTERYGTNRISPTNSTLPTCWKEGISTALNCPWSEGNPVLFHLKTKLGVNYDAGHWFHMAENFMVQHSILRGTNGLTNASVVIYNFDEGLFLFLVSLVSLYLFCYRWLRIASK